ncbi:MAPEG family protein [Spirulina major]|uniref:MAPEG family protein n=1 Tax=Spirulina major TaxID=270636 RepID=UPI00093290E1|nr:MAPEG family protein [Spirulina major]
MAIPVATLLLYSIVGTVILVYLPFGVVAYGRLKGGADLSAPRAMLDRLPDYAKRATWAHQNSFEALIVYGAAAFMAYVTGVEAAGAGYAAIAFLIARFFYILFYILDVPLARSLMFGIGMICSITLYSLSLDTLRSFG